MAIRVELSGKRVRVLLGGTIVADSYAPLLVWEGPHYPTYYLPPDDVKLDLLKDTGETKHSTSRGDAHLYEVTVGDRHGAASRYLESPIPEIVGYVRFDWASMDEWLEEDEPVYTHARDPYARIDILSSSRHVVVTLDGVILADTRQPRLLFETGLPTRYYIPMSDLALDRLVPSPSITHCPYKGDATYWSAMVGGRLVEDVAWTYRYPLPESLKIAGLVAFYPDKATISVTPG